MDEVKGFKRFTLNARNIILKGYEEAHRNNSKEYRAIHLFFVMLIDEQNLVRDVFERLGVDIDKTILRLRERIANQSIESSESAVSVKPSFSNELKQILNDAFVVASKMNYVYVGTEHIILSMFKSSKIDFVNDVKKVGISYEVLQKTISTLNSATGALQDNVNNSAQPSLSSFLEDDLQDDNSLPFFCTNMNDQVEKGEYLQVQGRDEEIQRLLHILSRKTKNNPILVGDAGVGKTAIVEGLAARIVKGEVPNSFADKTVMSLDIASILAGARLRGDVEERINSVIQEVIEDGDTILFIDEVHTIVGAGAAGAKDSMDIANILKPYLTKSDLSIIGATTYDEYSKYFETDSALTRRFQSITVEEIDIPSAKEIMYTISKDFEKYHKVKIHKDALDESVELSAKFIQDRYLPDKAIDIIDEASASIKIGREVAIEPELQMLSEKLVKKQKKKQKAIEANKLKDAAKYKKEEDAIVKSIEGIISGEKKVKKSYPKSVTTALVRDIILNWTKIPIVASDISDKTLKDLEDRLSKRVIGQQRAVGNVTKAMQRSHLGLNEGTRPLASFLFLGPTGVGKTELAKTLAKELFGSSDLLYQIDMTEFMEMHSVSKLIGSPPGYVGHQEGGQLTTFVRRKPYSVILFDEIEKAHPDTLNLLLQILEEGHLTDSKGIKVSFKNTVVIMTSNIGAEKVAADSSLGFDIEIPKSEEEQIKEAYDDMENRLMEELRRVLRPELLNRIDSINVFKGLNEKECLQITRNIVDDLIMRLVPKGIVLEVSSKVYELINVQGYSKEYGGRNIRRKVQELLEDGLAQFLISSKIVRKKGDVVKISASVKNDSLVFVFNK